MSRKVIIAGNWKMNKTAAEGKALVEALKPLVADVCPECAEIVVCPPFTTLAAVIEAARGSNIKVGAQNVHWAESGAFTGEISAAMLKETDETVNKRLKAALAAGLKPIVCIGELLEERETGRTEEVLARQLEGGLAGLTGEEMARVVIAYEPVWAIGTGKTATPEMAELTHNFIRCTLNDMFGSEIGEGVRIQYGGSMKPENAKELVAQRNIDGGLIGGAALKAESFAALVHNAIAK